MGARTHMRLRALVPATGEQPKALGIKELSGRVCRDCAAEGALVRISYPEVCSQGLPFILAPEELAPWRCMGQEAALLRGSLPGVVCRWCAGFTA